ncbi:MAG TPA: prolipoprotein diacylglyceryl transferase family protein [Symbiobacteriaceae bacterium]|jgi:phosphatidylglycerol:prolipoprotein diacylglycerol transferase|nr:prolipoprotein diacylglyceryl transferase family protein [Symbiobacteriaceae bacterium]
MPFLPDVLLLGQMPLATVALTGLFGGLLAYLLAGWFARREGSPPGPAQDLVANLFIGGVVAAKLVYVLLDPLAYLKNPVTLLLFPYGPLALPAGLVGGVAGVALGLRRNPAWKQALDQAAPPLALGLAIAVAGWKAPGSVAFAPAVLAAAVAAWATGLRPGRAPGLRGAQTLVVVAAALALADLARPGGAISGLQVTAALAGTAAWWWWRREAAQ